MVDPLRYTGPGKLTILPQGVSGEDLRQAKRAHGPGIALNGSASMRDRIANESAAAKRRKKLKK